MGDRSRSATGQQIHFHASLGQVEALVQSLVIRAKETIVVKRVEVAPPCPHGNLLSGTILGEGLGIFADAEETAENHWNEVLPGLTGQ